MRQEMTSPTKLMPFALLLGACIATPDLEYAPSNDPAASDAEAADAATSAPAQAAPRGHDASTPPKGCAKKDQPCASATDCCSGRCSEKGDTPKCG
jgi:hypothetical protein